MSQFSHHESCPECGSKDNVGVWEDGHKYCFGCGWRDGNNPYSLGIDNLRERFSRFNHDNKKEEGAKSRSVYLDPSNFVTDLPEVAETWLKQYEITDQEIRRLSIGYNTYTQRLVLPLFDDEGNLLVYQQRRMLADDPKPKYLTTGNVDGVVWTQQPLQNYYTNVVDTVVVVEDIVSAIKVGRLVPCVPLLGTNIPGKTLEGLYRTFKNLVVWLDPDKQKEALIASTSFRGLFETARAILSNKDPKEHSMKEIEHYLCFGGIAS